MEWLGERAMSTKQAAMVIGASILLTGCGLHVPEIQDFGNQTSGQQLIQSIIYNVTCEAQDAINGIYNNPDHPRRSTFLDTWGVQINMSLQVEEKSSASPTVNWLPPSPASSVFNLAGGGTLSADATRQDKTNSYFTVSELRKLGPCTQGSRPDGILLLQSDLGLYEWLNAQVIAADTHKIQYSTDYSDGPFKTNVLSHEVKFDATTSGNITPGWKLTRVLVNQSGNLFSATRDRTNDLIVTLGPTMPKPKITKDKKGHFVTVASPGPSDDAYTASLTSQIGLAVSNALKTSLAPQ
jgi:hypothetical protein